MPQILLPIFPENAVAINELLSFQRKEGFVYYFHGCMPIFSHHEDDLQGFRMFIAQPKIAARPTSGRGTTSEYMSHH
jgi:hypothetical protein